MYISIDLIIKIILIALSIFHILLDIWVLVKIHKKSGTSSTAGEIFANVKKVANSFLTYIEPKFPSIIGLVKAITGGEKTADKDDKELNSNG